MKNNALLSLKNFHAFKKKVFLKWFSPCLSISVVQWFQGMPPPSTKTIDGINATDVLEDTALQSIIPPSTLQDRTRREPNRFFYAEIAACTA
ncbi:hypothetical protein [uncultured Desulfuromonas sp.]|uniref:hypothetical protein n=1 Tax=uncultured Desulfuromonas sp. TaxID=181013 RepID=UPI002AAC4D76|nr:hypothetical protein [uncultured Desulfuromonas sp.]